MRTCEESHDAFTFSVLRSLMESIPSEMAEVVKRTSYHPIMNEVLDFSTALLDARAELLASAQAVTVHLGALELCAKTIVNFFGIDNCNPGDVFIHNNPFPGGTHLPDVDVMTPIFYKGTLAGFSMARGHHGDIGGAYPGSYAGVARSIFAEGVRIPPTKMFEAGKLNEGFINLFLANVRQPTSAWGDLQAQVAGCRLGEKRIQEMFDKYGLQTMHEAMAWTMDYSEQMTRAEFERIPDGTYAFEDYLDNDGIDKDRPVKIHVAITVQGSDMTVDFSKSDLQTKGPANCVLGNLTAAVRCALLNLTDPSISNNHGCYRPVTIIAREGLCINAKYPSAVVTGNTENTSRVIDAITGALARVMPDKVIASDSGTATAHIAGGLDPRTNEYYAWYLGSDPTAWGARATKDGFQCNGGPRVGGIICQIPMEVMETRWPFFIEQYSFAVDSGGPGKYRGGTSGVMILRPVGHDAEIGGAMDRCVIPPYGLFGGMPGLHGENKIIHHDGRETDISRSGGEICRDGEIMYWRAPGGGGYGNPLDRDLDHLQRDIENGLVTIEAAERDYGAVVDQRTGIIDREATGEKREKLRPIWKREEIFVDQMTQPYAKLPLRILRMDEQIP